MFLRSSTGIVSAEFLIFRSELDIGGAIIVKLTYVKYLLTIISMHWSYPVDFYWDFRDWKVSVDNSFSAIIIIALVVVSSTNCISKTILLCDVIAK